MDLRGKRALVMGLGVHGGGLGVARFLVEQGAKVIVTDLRSSDALQSSIEVLVGLPITWVLGEHRDEDFRTVDLVVQNPAVPRSSRYLQLARDAGVAIETEMTLFFRLCPGPILGITGTKGKTTTTLLTSAMLREHHPDTVVAGNLGISALEQLPRIGPQTPVVLELSSWQLEGLGAARLSPAHACVTNLAPDHLNRYSGMAEYGEAKRQILLWQNHHGVVVLNQQDPIVSTWAKDAPGQFVWFSNKPIDDATAVVYTDEGLSWQGEFICTTADIALPGMHNRANVAAAMALAKSFGVPDEAIVCAIRSFTGVEHRQELVCEIEGVRYINDTTATAPDAAMAALRSYEAPIVLIAGGADKQLPLEQFAKAINQQAKAVVLLEGSATSTLEKLLHQEAQSGLGQTAAIHGPFADFTQAVERARTLANAGDIILLSPGCASFGMFQNEFHRGEEFRRIVKNIC